MHHGNERRLHAMPVVTMKAIAVLVVTLLLSSASSTRQPGAGETSRMRGMSASFTGYDGIKI
jgi:hypothetical protein